MSHLHIPDGVLAWWIVVAGWAVTAVLLAIADQYARHGDQQKQLPLVGVMTALMLVGMTLEIPPLGYHLNLAVLTGILLGPALGFIAAFLANLILGLMGHSGVTVIGLNTLVQGVEATCGFLTFSALWTMGRGRVAVGLVVGAATIVSLCLSTLLAIGIVGLADVTVTTR